MLLYILFLLVFASIFLLFVGTSSRSGGDIRSRLNSDLNDKRKRSLLLRLLDLFNPINRRLGSVRFRERIGEKLSSSGSSLDVNEFFALKGWGALLVPALVILLFMALGRKVSLPWLIISAGVGIFLADIWLRSRVNRRHRAIIKDLPNAIDLLDLTVGAGLDFISAMNLVVEKSEPGPLTRELSIVCREVRVGKSRRDALRSMARRVALPEVSSFIRTLVQADRMGTSIEEALRMHSEDVRMNRFQRGERLALQAPLKLLIPLIFCILPVVLIIVGGPIFLQFMKMGLPFK